MPDRLAGQIHPDIDAGELELIGETHCLKRFRSGKVLDPNIQISAIIAKMRGQVFPGLGCKLFKIHEAWRPGRVFG